MFSSSNHYSKLLEDPVKYNLVHCVPKTKYSVQCGRQIIIITLGFQVVIEQQNSIYVIRKYYRFMQKYEIKNTK